MSEQQENPNGAISFHQGIVYAEEGYKYKIIEQSNDILKAFDWKSPDIDNSSRIIKMALDLLGICPSHGFRQNLVDYRDVMYLADQAYSSKQKDIEKALYLLYVDGDDKDAFRILANVLNKKYALISYFFFLKDSSQYQVVRPNNLAERFPLFGADPKCVLNCSWDNYQKCMNVLKEVQVFLNSVQTEKISLTDAHSFVWMLWKLSKK